MFRILLPMCFGYSNRRLLVFELVFGVKIANCTYYSELAHALSQVFHSFAFILNRTIL
jgi:hypothetical protein